MADAGQANTELTGTISGRFALNKNHEDVDIFIGVDVGKSNDHVVAIDGKGKKTLDRALLQDAA